MNEEVMNAEQVEMVIEAASNGVHEAQLMLGQILLDGRLVKKDPQQALYWFERSALAGNVMAMNMAGRCLDQGWGVAASAYLAEKWFRKAAERGLDWGMYNLATLLLLGKDGVPLDREQAYQWLCKSVSLGHYKSMNLLGGFYEDGWVVPADLDRAKHYYHDAAIGGDFRGQFNYARMLIDEGDILGALHWLQKLPQTATPAFLLKARSFLSQSEQHFALREFAQQLCVDSETKCTCDESC